MNQELGSGHTIRVLIPQLSLLHLQVREPLLPSAASFSADFLSMGMVNLGLRHTSQ